MNKYVLVVLCFLVGTDFCCSQGNEEGYFGEYVVTLNFDAFDTLGFLTLHPNLSYEYSDAHGNEMTNCDSTLYFFCHHSGRYSVTDSMEGTPIVVDFNPTQKNRTYLEILNTRLYLRKGQESGWNLKYNKSRSFPAYHITKVH